MKNSLAKTLQNDWSISATLTGFLSVLIFYTGLLIIFFQVVQKANISNEMLISWIWGIFLGMLAHLILP